MLPGSWDRLRAQRLRTRVLSLFCTACFSLAVLLTACTSDSEGAAKADGLDSRAVEKAGLNADEYQSFLENAELTDDELGLSMSEISCIEQTLFADKELTRRFVEAINPSAMTHADVAASTVALIDCAPDAFRDANDDQVSADCFIRTLSPGNQQRRSALEGLYQFANAQLVTLENQQPLAALMDACMSTEFFARDIVPIVLAHVPDFASAFDAACFVAQFDGYGRPKLIEGFVASSGREPTELLKRPMYSCVDFGQLLVREIYAEFGLALSSATVRCMSDVMQSVDMVAASSDPALYQQVQVRILLCYNPAELRIVAPLPAATPTISDSGLTAPDGLAGSAFTASELGMTWAVSLTGMVETGLADSNDNAGTCVVLFGTLIAEEIEEGLVSSGFAAPTFEILADGELHRPGVNDCDTSQVEAAGYQSILKAEVTAGTVYPFFTEFFLAEGTAPEAVVAGRHTSDPRYFSADAAGTIIAPDISRSNPHPIQARSLAGSGLSWSHSGTTWTVSLTGMIETGLADNNDKPGTCAVLYGTVIPEEMDNGLRTSGLVTPTLGMIVDGHWLNHKVNQCDTHQVEAAGYQSILQTEVTVGTRYPFFTEFFIPDGATPEAVVAGRPNSNDAAYFSPDTTDTITAP